MTTVSKRQVDKSPQISPQKISKKPRLPPVLNFEDPEVIFKPQKCQHIDCSGSTVFLSFEQMQKHERECPIIVLFVFCGPKLQKRFALTVLKKQQACFCPIESLTPTPAVLVEPSFTSLSFPSVSFCATANFVSAVGISVKDLKVVNRWVPSVMGAEEYQIFYSELQEFNQMMSF